MIKRPERIAEAIQAILSHALLGEIQDTRLKSAVITRVAVSRDLGVATVYWSSYQADPAARAACGKALRRSAAGYLRHLVATRLDIRRAPELRFVLDHSTDHAMQVEQLLSELAPQASQAEPATLPDGALPRSGGPEEE